MKSAEPRSEAEKLYERVGETANSARFCEAFPAPLSGRTHNVRSDEAKPRMDLGLSAQYIRSAPDLLFESTALRLSDVAQPFSGWRDLVYLDYTYYINILECVLGLYILY